ncbi:MAG: dihydroorotase, partial [Ferruginibacter sp.]
MKVLVKQAKINCVTSPFHGQVKDILIVDGKIAGIEDAIKDEAATKIDKPGLQVSTGWVDVFAHFADPGQEHKETLLSGGAAAAAGGFTDVFILPNTYPTTNTRSQVEYLKQKATGLPVNIHPIGNISKNAEGKELAEMYDMHAGGAVAFSDGKNAVQSAGMILKALQYVKAVDSILIQLPEDRSIGGNGLMNEGIMSTQLGMPGKPAIAEEIMIAREIELMKHTSSRLHITGVSTAKGIQLIKVA